MTIDNIRDVQFSREACVRHASGRFYNAFQMHTYLAKVEFDDAKTVIVVMPRMAASLPESRWVAPAVKWALEARALDHGVIEMPGTY